VPGDLTERRPRSQGRRYPPDPPRSEEIIAVTRRGGGLHAERARGLIAVHWRTGLRIQRRLLSVSSTSTGEAARCWSAAAKRDRRREVGIDNSGCANRAMAARV
jgi:hypothetical protein